MKNTLFLIFIVLFTSFLYGLNLLEDGRPITFLLILQALGGGFGILLLEIALDKFFKRKKKKKS